MDLKRIRRWWSGEFWFGEAVVVETHLRCENESKREGLWVRDLIMRRDHGKEFGLQRGEFFGGKRYLL